MFFFDVDEWFSVTREKDRKRIEKKIRQTLGEARKIEIRGATNNNDNNEKGGGRVLLERQCIFLFATQKRIRFRITKSSFLNCFIKKKTFGKASGRKRKRFLPSRANRHQGVCSYLHMMFTSTNHIFL